MYSTKSVNRVSHRWPRVARMDSFSMRNGCSGSRSALSARSPMSRSIRSMLRIALFAGVCAVLLHSIPSFAQTDAKTAMERGSDAMRSGSYRDAVDRYHTAYELADDPAIAAEALYWKAFALHRLGGDDDLEEALSTLETAREYYPEHLPSDLEGLEIRFNGALAKRGKASSAEKVQRAAEGDRRSPPGRRARGRS